jgi:hypothetical protein
MRPAFRTGPLVASSELLEAIPRTALVVAIVRHATSSPIHGEAVTTHHEHGPVRFRLETDAERSRTSIQITSSGWPETTMSNRFACGD